ncbi:hypothetical protein NDU88_005316 [Pleurodeles waltl]|uniref:Uncharacterized protein n=1 Tax=Pleurodeles waltl TaxID=8319 RepID=A0AAV7N5G8_PLEWA|nr:hypothetical protein NDU88_005316 [Pleurodeles waltl]
MASCPYPLSRHWYDSVSDQAQMLCKLTWLFGGHLFVAGVLQFLLQCFTAQVKRRGARMLARGSKAAPAGIKAWAATRLEKSHGSGGASESKTLRGSARSAAEPDKVRSASLSKVVSAPLVKYFKVKTHTDMTAKSKDITDNNSKTCGNVEPKINALSGDCVSEREEETHKDPPQIEKSGVPCTSVCANLSTKEVDEGNKLEKSNDSVSRDILAQVEVQAVTPALLCDLSTLNVGEEIHTGEQTG